MVSLPTEIEIFPTLNIDLGEVNLPHCRYLDIVNLPNYDWSNKFSVLICNIRSCRKKFLDFTCYFNNVIFNYSCIILVETWLTSEYDDVFTLRGFKSFNVYRNNYGGGIRLYARDGLTVTVLHPYTFVNSVFERLCVEVTSVDNKYILCCVYHPPTSNHELNYDFIEQLYQNLVNIRELGVPIVLGGDMNLNLFNPLKLNYIARFIDCLLELGLLPLINIPTKFNPNNNVTKYALLDQFWVSSSMQVKDAYVIPTEIADHYSVAVALGIYNAVENVDIKTRMFNHTNNIKFTSLLNDLRPEIVHDDMNETFNYYYDKLFRIYDFSYPMVTKTAIKMTENGEWLTPAIRKCIKKKSKLYKMYTQGFIYREDYTFYANKLTTLLKRVRKLYYFKLFLRDPKNSNRTWFYLNKLLGNSTGSAMEKLTVGDESLTGIGMVNYANNYFVSIANSLTLNVPNRGPYIFFTEANRHTFSMKPTDVYEVELVIKKLKNKGKGLFDISVKTIKNNSNLFSVHITLLYNYSIEKRVFPDELKIARVLPGHKSGQKDIIDNFRPISNLCVISKIFEKLTYNRMMSFTEKHDLLSECQFGFRKRKNITLAAMKLTSMIVDAYHERAYAACFFLDLRKAFDIIDHEILLTKLGHMGFRGHISQYLTSYITNRKQFVQIKDFKSNDCQITKGVPQGSILGPLLFCLFINDIVMAVDTDVVLFADDAAFFVKAPTLEILYERILKLFSDLHIYLEKSKLVPNLTKSKLMYFNSRPVPVLQDILFNGHVIEWVEKFKYLGLTITNKMSFGAHIDNVVNRISRFVGTFYGLRSVLPRCILNMLYFSFVLPHLMLHIEIWGAAPSVYMKKLETKNNMLLRSILGVKYLNGIPNLDTASMYKQLGVMSVNNVFKLRLFKFLVSLLKGFNSEFYELLLDPYLFTHNYVTRGSLYRRPLVTCEVERRALTYQLICLYDEVPDFLIDIENKSIKALVKGFRKYILSSQ